MCNSEVIQEPAYNCHTHFLYSLTLSLYLMGMSPHTAIVLNPLTFQARKTTSLYFNFRCLAPQEVGYISGYINETI